MMYPLCGYDACLTANDAPPRRNDVFALRQILRVASLRIITLSDGKPSPLPRGEASGHGKPCPYGNTTQGRGGYYPPVIPVAPSRVGATPCGHPCMVSSSPDNRPPTRRRYNIIRNKTKRAADCRPYIILIQMHPYKADNTCPFWQSDPRECLAQ